MIGISEVEIPSTMHKGELNSVVEINIHIVSGSG